MTKKISYLVVVLVMALSQVLNAQSRKVTGTITDATDGTPLPGVNIMVKGTTQGNTSDADGKYEINVSDNAVLLFSFIGYADKEVTVGAQSVINVAMESSATGLDEVVVTALGIKREERSLSYSTQSVKSDELTAVPSTNLLNNLAGKSSGVVVSSSSSGVGSSVKVVLRGNRSIHGNNQPLYVVDGVPITNFVPSQSTGGYYGGGTNSGDGISNINPEDIESMNILKGASAAALYGSQAANGVILITTKNAKTDKVKVNFSSSWQASVADMRYEFQDTYGGTTETSTTSWGAKKSGISKSFIDDFFETGHSFINSISISGGSKNVKNYLSYSNTTASGIMPENDLKKHNVSFRTSTSLFDGFIDVDGRVNLTRQEMDNPPSSPGMYFNPITGLYLFPGGTDKFNTYKENYEKFDPSRNINLQNWPFAEDIQQNPYWILNNVPTENSTNRLITKLDVAFNLTKDLKLKFRGSYDKSYYKYTRKAFAGTNSVLSHKNGRYYYNENELTQKYGDVLLSYNKRFGKLSLSATVGSSITDVERNSLGFDSNLLGLEVANLFSITNMINGGQSHTESYQREQLQSVFGTASFGYDNMLYLDLTARNDWSSTLPDNNNSYFYPSVGLSFVATELLDKMGSKPDFMDFAKVRFSWTQVGNDMPWGLTNPTHNVDSQGNVTTNTVKPFKDLEPELSTAYETGLDLRFFENRLSLDIAYYQTLTKNQYFRVDAPPGTGFSQYYINAGEVKNTGFEVSLGFTPYKTSDFEWNGWLNYSTNKNEVVTMPEQYKEVGFKLAGVGYDFLVKEGGDYGDMYVEKFKRDAQGRVIVDANGNPQKDPVKQKIGNVNPDFLLSLKNEFKYKDFSLSFLIDGRFGGKVVSMTQQKLNSYGVSKASADARDNGGVSVNAALADGTPYTKKIDAKTWYTLAPTGEDAIYDATNVRLRELALSYNMPQNILKNIKHINSVRFSFTARNLFFFNLDAPYDPETTLSTTSNGLSNADLFGLPLTRTYGLSINIGF